MLLPWMHCKPGFDDVPLRGVDHDRNPGNVGLGGDQVEEPDHRGLGIQHALVHVDINNLRAIVDLILRDLQCRLVVLLSDEAGKFCGAGHVGALANIDEE